jgi:hypothetical protein
MVAVQYYNVLDLRIFLKYQRYLPAKKNDPLTLKKSSFSFLFLKWALLKL